MAPRLSQARPAQRTPKGALGWEAQAVAGRRGSGKSTARHRKTRSVPGLTAVVGLAPLVFLELHAPETAQVVVQGSHWVAQRGSHAGRSLGSGPPEQSSSQNRPAERAAVAVGSEPAVLSRRQARARKLRRSGREGARAGPESQRGATQGDARPRTRRAGPGSAQASGARGPGDAMVVSSATWEARVATPPAARLAGRAAPAAALCGSGEGLARPKVPPGRAGAGARGRRAQL